MTTNDPARQLLGELLTYGAEALDISPELDSRLTTTYTDLGEWIRDDNESRFYTDSEVYPQGSRRIGTVTAPVKPDEDCDIDLVYRRDLERGSTTQQQLKEDAGEQLERYCDYALGAGLEVPTIDEGSRCWTLRYDGFHLDVLPALPDDHADEEGPGKDAIIITDTSLFRWQPSNPKAFARWFRRRNRTVTGRTVATTAGVQIEQIPEDADKLPLQRVVQLLKRHRDIFYDGAPENKPISIIITTLAAHAYGGERDIYDAFQGVVARMDQFIETLGGEYWVPNPTNPAENFADKWKVFPERREQFFAWLSTIREQLDRALRQPGVDRVAGVLGQAFGQNVATHALTRLGSRTRADRDVGSLRAAAGSAMLGSSGIAVPRHTFYGDGK